MRERPAASRLPLLALLVGLWAIVPPYVVLFGELHVDAAVEFVDHAVPGLAVIVVAVVASFLLRSVDPPQVLLLAGGGVITLAGFWMLSTHVGLISQTRQGLVPGGAVLWHGLPGLAVGALGVAWTARFWNSAGESPPSRSGR